MVFGSAGAKAAAAPDTRHLFGGNSKRQQELVVSLRGAALKFSMPPAHSQMVHPRGAKHFDPELLVYGGEPVAGSGLAQHSCQQALLVFELNDILGCSS